jgi:hypothetical protein
MSVFSGPFIYDGYDAKRRLTTNQYVAIRSKTTDEIIVPRVWADVTSDANVGWFLVFMAYPRDTSPYVATAVGSDSPNPNDTSQTKLADSAIQAILNNGDKTTRTQWFHTSVEFGTVWADGSLSNNSTYYNLFEFPSNWNSTAASTGHRYKRKRGLETSYTDWITSAGGTCSSAVGGWSNHYEQSCVVSWFAGCEGGPAWNHRCAGAVQDRASNLIIWAN